MFALLLTQASTEHCLYYSRNGNEFLVVAVFVDDFFVLSNSDKLKSNFKNEFKKLFTVKDLVLRYLKGTKDVKLQFHKGQINIKGYADADFGNSIIDRRSFTGYVFMMGGGPISWEARKQRTVALSITEAE